MRWLRTLSMAAALGLASLHCGDGDGGGDACAPDDQDGIVGVEATFAVSVGDTGFTPAILKAQNRSNVTLTVTNAGTREHGFAIDCLATPNDRGCPATSCFDTSAAASAIAPGTAVTLKFSTPAVEGIYVFRSNAPGDTATGQFILQ